MQSLGVWFDREGEPTDVLTIRRSDMSPLRPHEVTLRVLATPIHASDLHYIRGRYGVRADVPAIPGIECVGEVVDVGVDVRELSLGTRVVPIGAQGVWQEFVTIDAQRLSSAEGIDCSTAAQAFVNPLSAWLMVTDVLQMREGECLVQSAATSTVASLVRQLAVIQGFTTVNIVRSAESAQRLREDGVRNVLVDGPDLAEQLRDVLAARGVTKALDCVAGATSSRLAATLSSGGTLCVYGALSGHRQRDRTIANIVLGAPELIYRGVTLRGFWLYEYLARVPLTVVRSAFEDVLLCLRTGRLSLGAGIEVALDGYAAAIQRVETGLRGKVLLVPPG